MHEVVRDISASALSGTAADVTKEAAETVVREL
jgi:hypothetical protein